MQYTLWIVGVFSAFQFANTYYRNPDRELTRGRILTGAAAVAATATILYLVIFKIAAPAA